ncbi:hypothetical protein F5Y13DRAFT_202128 [Hypoxylon sp. FL1857]|nr:hypothetical protein F5Y13DRAFT_202128 [Hypoxylon sp. FL1857]
MAGQIKPSTARTHQRAKAVDELYGLQTSLEPTQPHLDEMRFDSTQNTDKSRFLIWPIYKKSPMRETATLLPFSAAGRNSNAFPRHDAFGPRKARSQLNLARASHQTTPDSIFPSYNNSAKELDRSTNTPFIDHMDRGTKFPTITNTISKSEPALQRPSIFERPRLSDGVSRLALTTLLYVLAGEISTSCVWIIRRYDITFPGRRFTMATHKISDVPQLTEKIAQGSWRYGPLTLVEPPPEVFITAVILYTLIISTIYCAHKDDKYQQYWLVTGLCISILVGFLSGADPQSVLLRLLPGAIAISLFLSACVHAWLQREQEACGAAEMYGNKGCSDIGATSMYADDKELA